MALMSLLLNEATSLLRSGWCGEVEFLLERLGDALGVRGSGRVLRVSVSSWDGEGSPGALVTVAMGGRAEVELDLDDAFRGFDEVGTEDNDLECREERQELNRPSWLRPERNRKLCDNVIRSCLSRGSSSPARLWQHRATYSASLKRRVPQRAMGLTVRGP